MVEEVPRSRTVIQRVYDFLKKIATPFIKLFSITSNYTGSGAEIVKTIPVLMIFFLITYPLWSLPVYIWLAVTYSEPLNYILYVLWMMQIVAIVLINAYFEHLRGHRNK